MTDLPDTSPNLGLPFYQTKLNEFEVQHNEALLVFDALVMLAVKDRDLSAPPSSPALGDRYLVKATGTGDFAGKDDRIAQYDTGGWNFYAPQEGWTCYVQDEHVLLAWDGDSWEAALDVLGGITEIENLTKLGIGTATDTTNPLSAKLNNVLCLAKTVAEGGDGTLRYKISKEDVSKTLSFLFQDNLSGRAEIGLTGDDDFHFKVSPDGTAWIDALTLDETTGAARLNSAVQLTGDITPSQITADRNDYSPTGLSAAAVLRVSTDASRNLTGLAGGADGRVAALVNVGTNNIVLKDASASSSAANRFAFGADVALAAKQSAVLWYDATDSRWKQLAGPQASGGGGVPADLDIVLAELALSVADALNVAQFYGSAGNRFADSFDALTYVDAAGATNLDSGTAGLLKPTVAAGSNQIPTMTAATTSGVTMSASTENSAGTYQAWKAGDHSVTGASVSWISATGNTTGTLVVDFGTARNIASYSVHATDATDFDATRLLKNWTLESSPNNSTWTTRDTRTNQTSWSASQLRSFTLASAFSARYWRVNISANNGNASLVTIGELALITAAFTNNVTVSSTPLTAAAAPTQAKLVARVKEIDSITLNTDLIFYVSRDGGTTYTACTMTDRFTSPSPVAGVHVLESASLDISGQPSGTSMKWKAVTANNKSVELHDVCLNWA